MEKSMEEKREYLDSYQIKRELCLMLKSTDEFLRKNNITYSIMSGTLLGAVRHGGFIPWDDDIDIAILRKDYNRLVNILKKDNKLTSDLFGSGFEVDGTDWPFIKIYNKSIRVREDRVCRYENLWIDVFPFDGVPKFLPNLNFNMVKILRKVFHKKREIDKFYISKFVEEDSRIQKKIARMIVKIIDKNDLIKLYIRICSKSDTNKCKYVQDMTWGTKAIPKALFDNLIDYKFENITAKGFKDYDCYLRCIYGDYMKLPPENKRVTHGIKAWRVMNNEE